MTPGRAHKHRLLRDRYKAGIVVCSGARCAFSCTMGEFKRVARALHRDGLLAATTAKGLGLTTNRPRSGRAR
jgi:hypothetical protein